MGKSIFSKELRNKYPFLKSQRFIKHIRNIKLDLYPIVRIDGNTIHSKKRIIIHTNNKSLVAGINVSIKHKQL